MDGALVGPRAGHAALAQPVEHIIRNDGVRCSSHLSGTTTFSVIDRFWLKKSRKSAALGSG
jgi:hypothetical protein